MPGLFGLSHKLLLCVALLVETAAIADDHLVPERSVFAGDDFLADYDSMIVSALSDAFAPDVRARAIVMPSFQTEYAVGFTERQGVHQAFCVRPETQLWAYETLKMMKAGAIRNLGPINNPRADADAETRKEIEELEASLPASFRDVKIKTGSAKVEADLANRLVVLWETMLRQTRYASNANFRFDGISYHFSMMSAHQYLAGQIWSPPAESTTGLLVRIVETLRRLCEGDVRDISGQLGAQADELRVRLRQQLWRWRSPFTG